MPRPETGLAIVGGVELLSTQALDWLLTEAGNQVLGCYAGFCALDGALRERPEQIQAAVVDAEDPAAGLQATTALRRAYPHVKIVLLCGAISPTLVEAAVREHVEGIVLKSDAPHEVIMALRHVLAGRAVMPAGWQEALLARDNRIVGLSGREREVLELAATGLSNKQIAERLTISTNTVKFHLRNVYAQMGTGNRVQATQMLLKLG